MIKIVRLKAKDLFPDVPIVLGWREHPNVGWYRFVCIRMPWKRELYDISSDEWRLQKPRWYFGLFVVNPGPSRRAHARKTANMARANG